MNVNNLNGHHDELQEEETGAYNNDIFEGWFILIFNSFSFEFDIVSLFTLS